MRIIFLCGGNSLSRDIQTSLAPVTTSSSSSGTPKAFPGHLGDLVPSTFPGSSLRAPSRGTCLEHLSRAASRRYPKQMLEPPQFVPWNSKGTAPSSFQETGSLFFKTLSLHISLNKALKMSQKELMLLPSGRKKNRLQYEQEENNDLNTLIYEKKAHVQRKRTKSLVKYHWQCLNPLCLFIAWSSSCLTDSK